MAEYSNKSLTIEKFYPSNLVLKDSQIGDNEIHLSFHTDTTSCNCPVFVNRIFSQKTIENSVTFFFDMAPVHFRCHMFYFAISSKLVPFSFNVSLNR